MIVENPDERWWYGWWDWADQPGADTHGSVSPLTPLPPGEQAPPARAPIGFRFRQPEPPPPSPDWMLL